MVVRSTVLTGPVPSPRPPARSVHTARARARPLGHTTLETLASCIPGVRKPRRHASSRDPGAGETKPATTPPPPAPTPPHPRPPPPPTRPYHTPQPTTPPGPRP